jgi:hypothetical protein
VITMDGSKVDPSRTLSDLGGPTRVHVARADIDLKVLCAVFGSPQIHTVRMPPLSTPTRAEPAIKAQCRVGERETEFGVVDESGATRSVDPARLVREFAGTGFMLVLRSRRRPCPNPDDRQTYSGKLLRESIPIMRGTNWMFT